MTTPISTAVAAYGNAQSLVSPTKNAGANAVKQDGQGPDFGKLLSETIQQVDQSGRVADQKALDMVNGKADPVDVVTAISQTELAVQGMVAVRDRVISAYQEIMRMPI